MNRPDAWFDGDGGLVVESSATTRCRRYLWYTAVGEAQSDPLDRSLPTNDETVEALLPAVLQQMRTAGWPISDAGPVSCQVGRLLATSGRPAALCRMALPGGGGQMQLFDKEGEGESDEMVLEVGAAGSTAEIIRRAALNTLGTFGAARPVVIAKVDPASFAWEAETIPLYSVDALVKDSLARLEGLGADSDGLLEPRGPLAGEESPRQPDGRPGRLPNRRGRQRRRVQARLDKSGRVRRLEMPEGGNGPGC